MQVQRDIFVISDLHLGDGGVRDNFEVGGRARQLHQFLDHVGAEGGELVILGDLFELWQMNTSRIFTHRRPLLDHFAKLPLVYVPGNHDVDLVHFIGTALLDHPFFASMRRPFDRQLGGRRFRFFHGHETDPFNASENPGFGQMLSIFAGLFEDQNKSPLLSSGEAVESVLEQFGESMLALWTSATAGLSAQLGIAGDVEPREALTPVQNPDRVREHVEGLRKARAREGWDVVVLGHTHKLGRVEDWYHNSGSWVGAHNSFLRVDPEGHVRYFEWKEGHAFEQAAPRVLPEKERPETKNPLKKAAASVRQLFPRPTPPERSRLILMAQGALALGVGIWGLFLTLTSGRQSALSSLILAFGVYSVIDGVLSLRAAAQQQRVKRYIDRMRGAVSIFLGLVFLTRRGSYEVLAVLVAMWALVEGVLRTAAALLFRKMVEARWLWVVGIGSIVAGLVLLFLPPTALLIADVVSGYLCFYGAGELMAGIFGRRTGGGPSRKRWYHRLVPSEAH
jgi:uncharacterized membrane protein HdeD (DUF308 family)/UDP-2,3-diacylglucosamine pyrophosphatase LpxH